MLATWGATEMATKPIQWSARPLPERVRELEAVIELRKLLLDTPLSTVRPADVERIYQRHHFPAGPSRRALASRLHADVVTHSQSQGTSPGMAATLAQIRALLFVGVPAPDEESPS